MSGAVPELRFPGFAGEWQTKPFSSLLERERKPVAVDPEAEYREIGVRSHGRGVFHKDPVSGRELGDKRVFEVIPDTLVLNIVFAWEQAVALTSEGEEGFIASHRFPMFSAKNGQSDLHFIRELLLTPRGKALLEMASPGGAGRNKTLGQDAFMKLKARVPSRDEQQNIATFLDTVSRKIVLLGEKKGALTDYKRGLMQRLFSRELRFTRDDGSAFPDWQERRLGDVFANRVTKASAALPVYSVTQDKGMVPRDSLDRDFGGDASITGYRRAEAGDLVYNTMRMWQGAVGISPVACCVSPAYVVLKPKQGTVPEFFLQWFREPDMVKVLQRYSYGLTEDRLRLYYADFSKVKIQAPHPDEQRKIAAALSALDAKIDATARKISEMEAFKKGLLQKLFI